MIFKSSTKVNLKKPYYQIIFLHPAYNNTFVFLGKVGINQECVTHVDKDGNLLFEHIFPKPMRSFGMINERQCILLQTRSKRYPALEEAEQTGPCITILDLQTYKFKRTSHQFITESVFQSHIRCFADTKFLCIQEEGGPKDSRLRLSYFNYPPKEDDKPFAVYTSKDDQWTSQYTVDQANHHSMIAWFKSRHDSEWEFKTYDLRDDPKGKLNVYKYKQQIGISYGMNNVQVTLTAMWQTTENCFMLVCSTNKTENEKNKELGVVQNNFICDTKTGKIRQAKFSLGEYQNQYMEPTYLGQICLFRTFDFKDGKPLPTPVYYVSNDTEQIVSQETWQCSHLHYDQPTGVQSGMLVHSQHQRWDSSWFICQSLKTMNPKEISLYFLLETYDNFDDDLLMDVINITDYSK